MPKSSLVLGIAKVELIGIEKRKLTFRVRAEDESGLIGEGRRQRAIINVSSFLERTAAKAESVNPA